MHCNAQDAADCHQHLETEIVGASGTASLPTDHSAPSYVVIKLKATSVVDGLAHTSETSRKVNYQ
jgi:hypothetical protein